MALDVAGIAEQYKLFLKLLKGGDINGDILTLVAKRYGFDVPPGAAQTGAVMVSRLAEEHQVKNIYELFTKPEVVDQVAAVFEQISGNKSVTAQASLPHDNKDPGSDINMSVNCVINCPACGGAFAIKDSPGVRKKLNKQ